jgi:hypothetical protein
MLKIEATIRVHCDHKHRLIDVEYGVGSERVPADCQNVSTVAKMFFEQGAIMSLQKKLSDRMPDILFNVVYVVGVLKPSNPPREDVKSNLIR